MFNKIKNVVVILAIYFLPVVFLNGQVTADFSSSETDACGKLKVDFFDQSTVTSGGSILSWEWELDEAFSAKQNPGAIFAEPGSFTICLTVKDNNGNTDRICKNNYINIYPDPVAEFIIDNTSGCSPATIEITDKSTTENGKITRWIWDIGGSANVIDTDVPMPLISTTYDVEGEYSLSLTVFDDKGCSSTNQKKDAVKINEFIPPDIDYLLISSCNFPWEIQFQNLSPDPEINYYWDFGNGSSFEGAFPPVIEYSDPGLYNLTLITHKGECTDTTTYLDYIDTEKNNDFQIDTDIVCAGTPVIFTDTSPVFADSVLWIFGDGQFSTQNQPTYSYDNEGCFATTLIRYRSDCTDTLRGQCIQVYPKPTISYSIDNQFACGLPTEITINGFSSGEGNFDWQLSGEDLDLSIEGETVDVIISEFGNYNLEMVFTDTTGCVESIKDIDLDIIPYSVGLPSLGPSGCIPLTAVMTDSVRSVVPIKSWDWRVTRNDSLLFSSSESSPSFIIEDIGKYDVELIVENIYGCTDTVHRTNYIEAGIQPKVDFTASPLESCVNEIKQFTDLSESIANSWFWDFGDSTFSKLQNPEKTYGQPGEYDVSLVAYHNGCGSSEYKSKYIVINQPRSAFEINYNCEDPFTVELLNRSSGADTSIWSIALAPGDTLLLTDSLIMPITFPSRGKYPVQLYSYNDSSGCENIHIDTVFITDPIADFTIDTTSGCAPLLLFGLDASTDVFSYRWSGEGAIISRDTFADPQLNYNDAGIYEGPTLRVIDIHGCQDSLQLKDSIKVNDIYASAIFDQIVCVPGNYSPIDSSTDVFGNIISHKWEINDTLYTSSDNNPVFVIETPTVYDLKLTVTDDWNCSDSIDYPMAFEGIELIPDFTADTLSCTWAQVRFRAKNTTPNVDSFYWDFGDGNFSIEKNPNYIYSSEGTYSICLTMIDKRGCSQVICKENYVTIQNPKAEFYGDPLKANCPPLLSNFTNLSENANTYFWDFGDNTGNSTNAHPSHVYTEPGFFDVSLIVTLNSSCRDTLIKKKFIQLEGPVASFGQEADSTCIPLFVTLNAQSDAPYSYIYDYGNGVLDSLPSKVSSDERKYQYTKVGRYVPKIIIIDQKGCARAIAGDPVFVNSIDLDFSMVDSSFCSSPATINIENLSASSSGNISYSWSLDGPQTIISNDQQPSFLIDSLGNYKVSLIGRSENCIDTLVKQDFVEISGYPEVGFNILNDQLCDEIVVNFENTTTIPRGLITSYYWDFGDGHTSTEENPSHTYSTIQSYNISLYAETRNGCSESFSMELPVSPSTVGYAGPNDTLCIGDSYRLSAEIENLQDGGDFYWMEDNSLSCTDCLDPVIYPSSTTMYTFVAVHPNGCASIDSVLITVIPQPGPTLSLIGDSIICLGDPAIFTVENYDTSLTYYWEAENGNLDCIINCETVTAIPDNASSFFVTAVNEYGCYVKDTFFVNVETDIGNITTEDNSICKGDSISIGIINGSVESWDDVFGLSCNNCSEPKVFPLESTLFYVNVISDEGCKYRDSVLVNVIKPESINAGEDKLICLGENISLTGKGIGMPSWFVGDSSSEIVGNTYNLDVSPKDTTRYILNTIEGECSLLDTIVVNVIESAVIESVGDSICYGESTILIANPILTDRYWWELPDGNRLENERELSVTPDSTDQYALIGSLRICQNDTSYVDVVVYDEIKTEMDNYYKIYANEDLQFNIGYGVESNYSFEWNPPSGLSCYNCPDPVVFDISSNLTYKVIITDEDTGCKDEQEVYARFFNECTSSVFILPNVFSPNQDGNNDGFSIFTQNEDEFLRIHVFDRWGNKVYFSEDINFEWDGIFQGDYLLSGVYTFRVDAYCDLTGEEYYFFGDITLLR